MSGSKTKGLQRRNSHPTPVFPNEAWAGSSEGNPTMQLSGLREKEADPKAHGGQHWAMLMRLPWRIRLVHLMILAGILFLLNDVLHPVFVSHVQFQTLTDVQSKRPAQQENAVEQSVALVEEEWRPRAKIAYLISAHDRSTAAGASLLVKDLYHPDHTFIIHVDRKVDKDALRIMEKVFHNATNVVIYQKFRVAWGQFTIVNMTLDMMRTAVEMARPFDAVVNLCGHTVALKSNKKIDEYLAHSVLDEQRNKIFIGERHACHPDNPKSVRHVCERTPARCADAACTRMTETPNGGFWYKGSQWWVLRREVVEFFLYDPSVEPWIQFWANGTEVADEGFFHSVFANSKFAGTNDNNLAIYIDWRDKCLSEENHRAGRSPCYLGACDLVLLSQTRKPFARKISPANVVRTIIRKLRKLD